MAMANLNYDLLTVLQNKLEAVAAYGRYIKDCQETGDKECQEWSPSSGATTSATLRSSAPRSSAW